MGMKGFVTGSLVTLGVVGLAASLKEADALDGIEDIFDDDDGEIEEDEGCGSDEESDDDRNTDGEAEPGAEKGNKFYAHLFQSKERDEIEALKEQMGRMETSLDAILAQLKNPAPATASSSDGDGN